MVQSGIREQQLTDLAKDLMKAADNINEIFNAFDDKFYELESCYQGKSFDDLQLFYSSVRNKYSTVTSNLVSYSDDFIALIQKMNEIGRDDKVRFKDIIVDEFEDEKEKKSFINLINGPSVDNYSNIISNVNINNSNVKNEDNDIPSSILSVRDIQEKKYLASMKISK